VSFAVSVAVSVSSKRTSSVSNALLAKAEVCSATVEFGELNTCASSSYSTCLIIVAAIAAKRGASRAKSRYFLFKSVWSQFGHKSTGKTVGGQVGVNFCNVDLQVKS